MKKNILLKTKQRFIFRIYLDITFAVSIIVLGISIPLGLASFFTPNWILYEGLVVAWMGWALIIGGVYTISILISEWMNSRWVSSRKQAEAEVKNE